MDTLPEKAKARVNKKRQAYAIFDNLEFLGVMILLISVLNEGTFMLLNWLLNHAIVTFNRCQ